MSTTVEPWLRGPLPGVDPYLMPAAHALMQSSEDLERVTRGLAPDALWSRPGGAAAIGFHLRHIAGSIDRLLTYARGGSLDAAQLAMIRVEGVPGEPPAETDALVRGAQDAIARAIDAIRATPHDSLLDPRSVGRKALPSTVLGLLFHMAEHTQRHTGQVVATAKIAGAAASREPRAASG